MCICNKVRFWPKILFIFNKLVFLFLSLHNDLLYMWLDWKVATKLLQNHLTLQHWRKTSRQGCTKLEKKNKRTRTKQYQGNKNNSLAGCCMNNTVSHSFSDHQSTATCQLATSLSQLPHWLHQLPPVGIGQCNHQPAYQVSVASPEATEMWGLFWVRLEWVLLF